MCAPCFADEQKRIQEEKAKEKTDEDEARKYIQSGSARTALLASGVQPVNIYQTQMKLKKEFLSRNNQ
jgi:hypothetical protein